MKTKILLWSIVFFLTTTFAAENAAPGPSIAAADGTKVTYLGVTYGREAVAPNLQAIAGHVGGGNWIHESHDVTVVWFAIEHDPKQWPSFSLLVSDLANTAIVRAEASSRSHMRDGLEVHGFVLRAYPRWDKQFYVRIADPYGKPLSNDKILVTNPDWKDIGTLTVEALPVTKTNGDITVTLTNLVTGAPLPPYDRRADTQPDDPRSQCVRIGLDVKQNGHAATNWHPWVVVLSDVLSNRVNTTMQFQDNEFMRRHWRGTPFTVTEEDEYKGYFFRPGLWPNAPAWNIRIEFTRDTGFNEDEILTLTNLPVRRGSQEDYDQEWTWEPDKTNLVMAEYTVNGVQLRLLPPLLVPDKWNTNQMRIGVLMRPNPDRATEGMRISLLQATDENGHDLGSGFATAGYNCSFDFPNQHEVKSINLKFALHRSRYVTFTVKPERQ